MLTEEQKKVYKNFLGAIIDKDIKLLSSEQRAWGKSYILNELGFMLQALGYRVFLLTDCYQDHFATNVFTNLNSFRGVSINKLVVIVDEYIYSNMNEILKYCTYFNIPVVGFVDYI